VKVPALGLDQLGLDSYVDPDVFTLARACGEVTVAWRHFVMHGTKRDVGLGSP